DQHALQLLFSRRAIDAPVDEHARARQSDDTNHNRGDASVAHGIGSGSLLEHAQVLVNVIAGFVYLTVDVIRRSAHSLLSFRLSSVLVGRPMRKRALPK